MKEKRFPDAAASPTQKPDEDLHGSSIKAAGVIAEFNPFHQGHAFLMDEIRRRVGADYIIVVMSGDFVQRGAPAILPKRLRAAMALAAGADLVLELPVEVSTGSAEYFARGGVRLLDSLGVAEWLCFGVETCDPEGMRYLADLLGNEPEALSKEIAAGVKNGRPFPIARRNAIRSWLHAEGRDAEESAAFLMDTPNNLLGIEYMKAIRYYDSPIVPICIRRQGAGYHETGLTPSGLPSATALRAKMETNPALSELAGYLPESACLVLSEFIQLGGCYISPSDFDTLLGYRLLCESEETLQSYFDVAPGLANRIEKFKFDYRGFSSFAANLKSRELTLTRVQRALLHILLGIERPLEETCFARVLGIGNRSGPLLHAIGQKARIPLETRPKTPEQRKEFEKSCFASNLYQQILCRKTHAGKMRHDYEIPLVKQRT